MISMNPKASSDLQFCVDLFHVVMLQVKHSIILAIKNHKFNSTTEKRCRRIELYYKLSISMSNYTHSASELFRFLTKPILINQAFGLIEAGVAYAYSRICTYKNRSIWTRAHWAFWHIIN